MSTSKKTPNNETGKIKSAPRRRLRRTVALLVLAAFVLTLAYVIGLSTRKSAEQAHPSTYTLVVGGSRELERAYKPVVSSKPWRYTLKAARTPVEQAQGLSDTKSLASNQGMLFINDTVDQRCFWMKDMLYPLDIIWLDSKKTVVHIEKNLSPDSYPQAFCIDAQYVIELNAGEADKSGITDGQVLSF